MTAELKAAFDDSRQILAIRKTATQARNPRSADKAMLGCCTCGGAGGGGMDEELMSFGEYLDLKKEIARLKKRNAYLSHRVTVLSKRLGINKGSKKIKILSLIENGLTAAEIKAEVKCSLSLVYEYISDYKKYTGG